jgi:putative phage-type endonuclease
VISVPKQTLSNFGIGASEIGAVCGLNPFTSPWDVWMRKTGQAPEVESNQPMEWGNRLEAAIRQKYVDETGATVYVPTESMFHAETPWARATPDGIVVSETFLGRQGLPPREFWQHLVQIKNVSYWMGREWESAPPAYVQLQEIWEQYVTGLDRADVAALIGGSDYRCFTIHKDEQTLTDLLSIASDFWRRVEQRIPPEIDNSAACKEHLEKRLAKSSSVELVADQDLESLFSDWRKHSHAIKHSTREVDRIRNVVRSHLADAQADRIVSSIGTAKLDTNKKLLTPREWAKESA